MNRQIVISGVGGQGVLFVTGLLAKACMDEGRHVLTSETHGMAQRGGSVISHIKIGDYASPLIRPGSADLLVILKSENLAQHRGYAAEGAQILVNAAPETPLDAPAGSHLTRMDADRMAEQDGRPGSVNLYLLGAALAVVNVCPLSAITGQLEKKLTSKAPALLDRALHSLKRGFEAVDSACQKV